MRVAVLAIIACFLAASAAAAADGPRITLNADALALKDATEEVAKQAGISIVLDPNAKGTITASLTNAEVGQVLDVITKTNGLTWKKLQFARKADDKVGLDQLKSGILALASMPLTGLAVEDPASKTSALFAKDIPSAPDTSKVALPEGHTWTTVYVVLAPEAPTSTSPQTDKARSLAQTQAQAITEMARMNQNDRQAIYRDQWTAAMRLTPEARQAMLRDQMSAIRALDPQTRSQLLRDMSAAMRSSFGATIRQDRSSRSRRSR